MASLWKGKKLQMGKLKVQEDIGGLEKEPQKNGK